MVGGPGECTKLVQLTCIGNMSMKLVRCLAYEM